MSTIQAPAAGGQYTVGVSTGSGCSMGSGHLAVVAGPFDDERDGRRDRVPNPGSGERLHRQPHGHRLHRRPGTDSSGRPPAPAARTRVCRRSRGRRPLPITQGAPPGGCSLNATASVAGTFTYAPPAGTGAPGRVFVSHSLTATFVPVRPELLPDGHHLHDAGRGRGPIPAGRCRVRRAAT
ncbi:MAG: hypothetical protein MZV49_25210 [Rhodopseudomonas palustris]|nr:hypothetical protein [Rhodopseudomonas palustris]